MSSKQLETILHQHGQSITAGRKLIFDILWRQKPMPVSQIVEKVGGTIDRASVYRTLTLFEKIGIVQRVTIGWKHHVELAGPFSHHHHHLVCLQCQAVIVVADSQIEEMMNHIASKHGYALQQHQFEIQGICKNCRRKRPESSGLLKPA